MKKIRSSILITLVICFIMSISTVDVFAKGSSSFSSRSSSSSSSSKSSSGGFSSKSSSSSSKPSSSSTNTPSKSTSNAAGSGFKSGSFSSSKSTPPPSKSTATSGTINNKVDTSSPALKSIPKDYSSRSVNNHYYYNDYGNSGWNNFWSHYWFYRAMTPDHRVYYVNDSPQYAPAYTGGYSVVWDVLTFLLIAGLISWAVYYFWWRKRR